MNLPQTTADTTGCSCVNWAEKRSIARAQLGKEGGNITVGTADFLVFPPIFPCTLISRHLPRLTAPSPQPTLSLHSPLR